MFWLIETQEQFEDLKSHKLTEILAIPIGRHPDSHPAIYSPLCLYVKDVLSQEGYLINFLHSEAMKINADHIREWLETLSKIYTPDRKAFNYFHHSKKTISLPAVKEETIQAISYFSRRYYTDPDQGNIIPVVKHYEHCEKIAEQYLEIIPSLTSDTFRKDVEDIFWVIERNGLKVSDTLGDYFNMERPFLSLYNNHVLTQYNLNNTTGRPSNNFNSINFAALNKENGCRSAFVPRNDLLMEIDLVAYHPTLISKLVGYESLTGDIYEDFGEVYGMDRKESKSLVFKQLYGNVFEQYKDFEFFKLTTKYIDELWSSYKTQGYVDGVDARYRFYSKDLLNMNPQKLFNYVIQNYETVSNVGLLKEILYLLEDKKSKVVLYTYDAILLDLAKEDTDTLRKIVEVFKNKNLKITMNVGKNYNSLQPF